jgi:quinol monooxygenase YgiN
MIFVLASIQVRPGKLPAFLERFKANVPNVINEDGCIEYIPTIDIDAKLTPQVLDENIVTIIEKWESLEHLHTHLKASHMLSYREEVKDMVENTSLKVLMDV